MRKLLITVGVFVVGFVAGAVLLREGPTTATAQGGAPECAKLVRHSSGALVSDVNGDGSFDISDAVYILNFLFTGGGAPKPICGGPLPATGVTECADQNGTIQDPCPTTVYPGQDGFYQTGCPMLDRFVVNDNGTPEINDDTVTDTCTGLMWQRRRAEPAGEFDPDPNGWVTWERALDYCDALGTGPNADAGFITSHSDWRLPNVRQLQSIINYGRRGQALPPEFDIQDQSGDTDWYWTSSSFPGNLGGSADRQYSYTVNLEYGNIGNGSKTGRSNVLAVRPVQSPK